MRKVLTLLFVSLLFTTSFASIANGSVSNEFAGKNQINDKEVRTQSITYDSLPLSNYTPTNMIESADLVSSKGSVGGIEISKSKLSGAPYYQTQKKEDVGKGIIVVEVGDLIEVNYIGRFPIGDFFDNGTVFDTNIESVANDENIPKAYSFKPRTSYLPLKFTVGSGQMIEGFDEGVLGMAVGETKNITVPPEEAYGYPYEYLVITINKTQSIPLYETISSQEFYELYPEVSHEVGVSFTHYFWGWNATIDDINGDNVTILNKPDINSIISVFGWNSTIIEINSSYNAGEGRILLQHNPAGNITINMEKTEFLAIDNEGLNYVISQINIGNLSVSDIGIVSSVNTDSFIVDYNPEIFGKTLIFETTILSISGYPDHDDPIYIDGNSDFASQASTEGWQGDGTEGNPYIIEGYDIDASTAHGIHIENTDVYFIIRNCVIHDGKDNWNYGIYFYSVQNGKMDNVTSYNNYCGICLDSSSNNTITNCAVYNNNWMGIYLPYSSNNQISNCEIYNNSDDGIWAGSSTNNNTVTDCDLYNNFSDGIELVSSSNNTITNCAIYNNSNDGISLRGSPNNNTITNCAVYNNSYGIRLCWYSSDNEVHYCNIYNNANYGVYNLKLEAEYQVNATHCWWGSADGPGQDGANPVSSNVLYDQWLTQPWDGGVTPLGNVDFSNFHTPTIKPGESGELSFTVENNYDAVMENVYMIVEIYKYATEETSKDVNEISNPPVFINDETNIITYNETIMAGSSIQISLIISTSEQTPQGTYLVRMKTEFDLNSVSYMMMSIGYFSDEELMNYQLNSSHLPSGCSGIIPETSFCTFIATGFDVMVDGYNFTNYGLDIDSLSLTGFLKAFEIVPYGTNVVDPIWLPVLYGLYLYAQFGGHCYGISSTSILYMENLLSLPYNVDYAFELTKSQSASNINAYQSGRQVADILYDTISARYAHLSPQEQYTIIKDSIQNGEPIMVLMTSESGGHAVVAYKIIEDSSKAIIYIYDSNHNYSASGNLFKQSFPYIIFNFTTSKFSYLDYTEFRAREPTVTLGNVSQDMINDLISLITSMLRNNNLIAVTLDCPGDLLITDNQGRRTGIVNGVVVNEIPNAYIVSSDETEVYFVPSNMEYSCKITGAGGGYYTLKMITPEQDFTRVCSVNSTLTTNTIDNLKITSNGNVINITASEDKIYTLTITNKTNVTISTFFVSNVTINGTVMHSYSIIDWSNLGTGKPVSLGVDKNNDGIIDAVVELSSGMTGEEINNLIKEQEVGAEAGKPSAEFPSLIFLIVPIVAIVLIIAIVILVMRRRKIKTKGE
ncbi:MAG: right-handed parallel beta-helix repeat-containing protein [Thermoplasmatales archaeon]|nr:right-handed parallel beta-helix repeat-containing protein [Thermoplasmatales archaeon]